MAPTWGAMKAWATQNEADNEEAKLRIAKAKWETASLGRDSGGGGGSNFASNIQSRFDPKQDARDALELRQEENERDQERAARNRDQEFNKRQAAMEAATIRSTQRDREGRDSLLANVNR